MGLAPGPPGATYAINSRFRPQIVEIDGDLTEPDRTDPPPGIQHRDPDSLAAEVQVYDHSRGNLSASLDRLFSKDQAQRIGLSIIGEAHGAGYGVIVVGLPSSPAYTTKNFTGTGPRLRPLCQMFMTSTPPWPALYVRAGWPSASTVNSPSRM